MTKGNAYGVPAVSHIMSFTFFLFLALIICPHTVSADDKKSEYGTVIGIGTCSLLSSLLTELTPLITWEQRAYSNHVMDDGRLRCAENGPASESQSRATRTSAPLILTTPSRSEAANISHFDALSGDYDKRVSSKQLHPRAHDAPHVHNIHRRRRLRISAPQPRLLSFRKTCARYVVQSCVIN
ncbi:hypothetical protein EI94DRAFT_30996 [Lactarius quietus]|nr:hypothetical protein EI94DRAFT_30996 [Lactarius quietus]